MKHARTLVACMTAVLAGLVAAGSVAAAGRSGGKAGRRAAVVQYKRFGLTNIRLICQGRTDRAARACQRFLAENPDDAEAWFVLAVARVR
ncbi:MAG: tetratricopeptide repeat protein, partial [Planctomycetes bacterium]|nr:tetratricopeptide repeat protein [Planctomycetota bacterium]